MRFLTSRMSYWGSDHAAMMVDNSSRMTCSRSGWRQLQLGGDAQCSVGHPIQLSLASLRATRALIATPGPRLAPSAVKNRDSTRDEASKKISPNDST